MSTSITNTNYITYDTFTKLLLQVHQALVKREAVTTKRDFAATLLITSSFWNNIEARINNYPQDLTKRKQASVNLQSKYYVNPQYLFEISDKMFLKEPPKVKGAVGEGVAKLDFRDKKVKESILTELESEREARKKLEEKLAQVSEELNQYKKPPKSDKNPDKKK